MTGSRHSLMDSPDFFRFDTIPVARRTTMDYRREDRKKVYELRGDISLEFLFKETPITTPKRKEIVQIGYAFKGTAFGLGFGVVKLLTRL